MNVSKLSSLSDLYRSYGVGRSQRSAATTPATTQEPATQTSGTTATTGTGSSSSFSMVIDLKVRIQIQLTQSTGSTEADQTRVRHQDEHHGSGRRQIEQLRRGTFGAVREALSELPPLTDEQRKEVRAALRTFAKELRTAWRDAREAREEAEETGATEQTAQSEEKPARVGPPRSAIESALNTLLESLKKIFGDGTQVTPPAEPPADTTQPAPNDPLAKLPDLFAQLLDQYEKWLGAPAQGAVPPQVTIPEDGMPKAPTGDSTPVEPVVAA